MKYSVFTLLASCLLFTACKDNVSEQATPAGAKGSIPPQVEFFPVPDYIGGELKMIDSLQLPLSKSVTVNNTTRSAIATDSELRYWARNFQEPDISDPALKNSYTETSIADQSAPSVTLIYTTSDHALPVQKINVYIKPSSEQNDKVTGIYMEKIYTLNDTLYNQQLYWKSGKNLQVTTEKKIHGNALPVEKVKITWDPS
ncbi:MAG: hypothetical protein ABI813_13275 [Bacteroidota bacterium]